MCVKMINIVEPSQMHYDILAGNTSRSNVAMVSMIVQWRSAHECIQVCIDKEHMVFVQNIFPGSLTAPD